jgi:asparagine synthase (glutamine-hydrolysing)
LITEPLKLREPAGRIALPDWVAHAAPGGRPLSGALPSSVRRIGPFTLFDPSETCEAAPLAGSAGTVLFDGYLFDRSSLVEELALDADVTSAAIVAAAFGRWKEQIVDRLDGAYLVAVWDAARRRLIVGHDALGRHPVFYAREGDDVWLSPNILALARSGRVPARPNRLSLALGALLYWPEAGETHIEAIRRVRPGHYLEIAEGRLVERKYWEPMPADDELLSEREVAEEFEPSLERAVGRCLDLSAQGIMLSGGLDSVTVAAVAASLRGPRSDGPFVAVSARAGGPLVPEEEMQTRVSDALGMLHVISTTTEWLAGRDALQLSLDLAPDLPSPTRIWWVGTYTEFYRRTAASGLTVLLTGAGGDNWLGVADTYAADLLRCADVRELWRLLHADMHTGGASAGSSLRRLLWASGGRPHLDTAWARLAPAAKDRYHRRKWLERLPRWLAPDRALRDELVDRLLARRTPSVGPDGRPPRSYYLHSLRTLVNPYMHFENETAFHIEAMCGLRLLSPYHDRRLVSFFNRIPPRALIHGARYKGLLRPVAEKYLPALGLDRQRKDYPADRQNRKLLELRESVARAWSVCGWEALQRLGVVDAARLPRPSDFEHLTFEDLAQGVVLMTSERWLGPNAAA